MKSLKNNLSNIAADAFEACGFDPSYGQVVASNRPDLGQFQCNGALAAAKQYKKTPRLIAQQVVEELSHHKEVFQDLSLEGPGFINLTLTDEFLVSHIQDIANDARLGCEKISDPQKIIIDYGGANIAKPLHVGHLRSAIIGECLKRLGRFLGHEVLGDVHLGDWGLQMGMVISEIARRQPALPYFDTDFIGEYPVDPPVTIDDLEEIYPQVSENAKDDPEVKEEARLATLELQRGHAGYRALWQHFCDVSIPDLRTNYGELGVHFDLWLGEHDAQKRIPGLIERLQSDGLAYLSDGALVIDVAEPEDKKPLPPFMMVKSDGSVLYGTTDLATIDQRVEDFKPDLILYVVDRRQSDHFNQVFRSAHKTGIAPTSLGLEHIGFGTMNGKDGKPFKTREGGVMKLRELIQMVTDKALELLKDADIAKDYDEKEKAKIAHMVGIATLKYADLINHRTKNYVFDIDRFASFEGSTGPYLLYTAVRIKSILRNAAKQGLKPGSIIPSESPIEREMLLKLAELPELLNETFENRAPNHLCEYAYNMASQFNSFYHNHHILREKNASRQASWLALVKTSLAALELVLDLLGIEVPERM